MKKLRRAEHEQGDGGDEEGATGHVSSSYDLG
jgi:hypothetical protein